MKIQKIRVKVLIGPSGDYIAHGWLGALEKDPDETLYNCNEELGAKEYWLTAELPIPQGEAPEVEAQVEHPSRDTVGS